MLPWNTVALNEGYWKISNSEKMISFCKSWGEKWWILEVIISSPMTCDSNILQLVLYQRFYPEKLQFRVNSRSIQYAKTEEYCTRYMVFQNDLPSTGPGHLNFCYLNSLAQGFFNWISICQRILKRFMPNKWWLHVVDLCTRSCSSLDELLTKNSFWNFIIRNFRDRDDIWIVWRNRCSSLFYHCTVKIVKTLLCRLGIYVFVCRPSKRRRSM